MSKNGLKIHPITYRLYCFPFFVACNIFLNLSLMFFYKLVWDFNYGTEVVIVLLNIIILLC